MTEGILDWEDLNEEDQKRAEELLHELNDLFRKYEGQENCEDSTSHEQKMYPESQGQVE